MNILIEKLYRLRGINMDNNSGKKTGKNSENKTNNNIGNHYFLRDFNLLSLKNYSAYMLIYVLVFMPPLSVFTGAALFGAPPLHAAGDANAAPEVKKDRRYEVNGVVESISAPLNPRETLMAVDCGDSSSVELILSPATKYYPGDYYPCAGDRIKVNYVVLGIFKKYVMAYSVSLIEEFSGINKDSYKIIKKD
jgi:hypothetical protein